MDQIFILKEIDVKGREQKRRVYVGLMDLEKVVNREVLWQVIRIYSCRW